MQNRQIHPLLTTFRPFLITFWSLSVTFWPFSRFQAANMAHRNYTLGSTQEGPEWPSTHPLCDVWLLLAGGQETPSFHYGLLRFTLTMDGFDLINDRLQTLNRRPEWPLPDPACSIRRVSGPLVSVCAQWPESGNERKKPWIGPGKVARLLLAT